MRRERLTELVWRTARVEVRDLTLAQTGTMVKGVRPASPADAYRYAVVVNLSHAWDYLLDSADQYLDFAQIRDYNRILGQGIMPNAGRVRMGGVHVDDYVPPLPTLDRIAANLNWALDEPDPVRRALLLYMVVCRGQWFADGNKRTAALTTNHSLMHDQTGLVFALPENLGEYVPKLLGWYRSGEPDDLAGWLAENAVEKL